MGRKQKHNRLKVEQGGVSVVYTMVYDGSVVMHVDGEPGIRIEYSGEDLAALAEMFGVAAEQQAEDRILSEQFRVIARSARLAKEPLPEQPEPLPEF